MLTAVKTSPLSINFFNWLLFSTYFANPLVAFLNLLMVTKKKRLAQLIPDLWKCLDCNIVKWQGVFPVPLHWILVHWLQPTPWQLVATLFIVYSCVKRGNLRVTVSFSPRTPPYDPEKGLDSGALKTRVLSLPLYYWQIFSKI